MLVYDLLKIIAHLLAGPGGIAGGVVEQQPHDQRHQLLARRYRQSSTLWDLRGPGIVRAGKQIELKRHGLARHEGLLDACRESLMLRPKSAEPKWVASPAAALPDQPARQYRHGEPPRNAPWRKRHDRTSIPEPHDSAPTPNRLYCSGKCSSPPAPRSHERVYDARPNDATDSESREHRSRGRSVAALYNECRPHTSLGWMTPSEFASPTGVNPGR
jgi:hypothetical protein